MATTPSTTDAPRRSQAPLSAGPTPPGRLRRAFTAAEVRRMQEAGILGEDEPLELIDGELLLVSPQGATHASTVQRLRDELTDVYRPRGACVRSETPTSASETSEPEPDLAVVPGTHRDYEARHPAPAEALVLLEVAVSNLDEAQAKAGVYARAGAPVYWLLDVSGRRLEVRTHPDPVRGGYRRLETLSESDSVSLPGTDLRWLVSDLLPATPRG